MFRSFRIRRAHERFLASCRILTEDRAYWGQSGGLAGWLLQRMSPVPALGLHEDGEGLLSALRWLEAHAKERRLGEDEIRYYHRMVFGKKESGAGEYRRHPVSVVGSKISRAAPERVPFLMSQLIRTLTEEQAAFDGSGEPDPRKVLKTAVDLHQRIGLIHPFSDANGRVARLAMNHLLRRYGMGYVIFPPLSQESPLWEALQQAHRGDLGPLTRFASECLLTV
jgi:fido (protein-threonine AMPylation protein)